MRYRDAGVDVSRSDAIKDEVVREIRSTWTADVAPIPGGFAGVMRIPSAPPEPGTPGARSATPETGTPGARSAPGSNVATGSNILLAATMDGVGTKLHLAKRAGRLADAAADLVYHTANDLLVHGGRPLAFLDYVAQATLEPADVLATVRGLARACREVGAALLGGETAEMPDTYLPGVIDVAGCMLGVVAGGAPLDGSRVRAGDRVLGVGGSGLHTNGYSLARRVLAATGLALEAPLPGGAGERVGEALLAPHRWYGPALMPLIEARRLRALAHVTGGGIAGNLVRVLPAGVRARVHAGAWPRPAVFRWLVEAGGVPEDDARVALNLGLGMLVIVEPGEADAVARALVAAGETVWPVGDIVAGERGVDWVPA